MGQSNSKQGAGAVSDENRLLYPIGGGHVGEGPVYVNPIAEGSQQQLPRTQEKPGQLQPEPGSAVPASAESQSKEISSSGKQANAFLPPHIPPGKSYLFEQFKHCL